MSGPFAGLGSGTRAIQLAYPTKPCQSVFHLHHFQKPPDGLISVGDHALKPAMSPLCNVCRPGQL